jgi:hypothetical protein
MIATIPGDFTISPLEAPSMAFATSLICCGKKMHVQLRISFSIGNILTVISVTKPKNCPAPFKAQKRSAFSVSDATTSPLAAVITLALIIWSIAMPYIPVIHDCPPPSTNGMCPTEAAFALWRQKPALWTAWLRGLVRTPAWMVAVWASTSTLMPQYWVRSTIHPEESIVDHGLWPPAFGTKGIECLTAYWTWVRVSKRQSGFCRRLAIWIMSSSEEGKNIAEGIFTDASLHLCIKRLKSSEEGLVKMPVSGESEERRLIAASATDGKDDTIFTELHKRRNFDAISRALYDLNFLYCMGV